MNQEEKKIEILGVKVSILSLNELLGDISDTIKNKSKLSVGNVNIFAMNIAYTNPSFREILNKFDVVFCDGFGVKIGASLLGVKIPQRYTPPDFIYQLMQIVQANNGSVYLLGSKPGIAERAAAKLCESTANLIVSGTHHGFFDKTNGSKENEAVLSEINQIAPSLILVAFGMPIQEEWIMDNWYRINASVILSVGALFDTLSGEVSRGPKILTNNGFEWLSRLVIEPHRLWKRYLIGNPIFFWRILRQRFFMESKKNKWN